MTREQEALLRYAEENRLAHRDIAEIFDYSKASVTGWLSGKSNIPPIVLLTIGFYAPVYQPEIDEVNRYRFKVADAKARRLQLEEDRALRKLNGSHGYGYANRAEKNKAVALMRRWCEVRGFIGKRGGCDISRAAAYLNRSYSTVSSYIYGDTRLPKEIAAQIVAELEAAK